jgi:hypothetical protein
MKYNNKKMNFMCLGRGDKNVSEDGQENSCWESRL